MNREEVITQIDSWEIRLQGLVAILRAWYDKLPANVTKEFLEGAVLQVDEGMLTEYDIPPRMLPHCAVIYNNKRLSLVPGPLWVLGSNGRVNLITNKRQFLLVDLGGRDGNPSNWQIVTSQIMGTYRPFTEEIFQELVQHQELDAA